MTPDRWSRIEALFDEAVNLAPADRVAFLDAACRTADGATDAALREEVERMLALDAGADTFFERFAEGGLHRGPAPAPPEAGSWRLVERVGQGGMGEVWRAERAAADGFRQSAAVKLVRPGLGEDLVARFRAERRILAGLDHPAIARLLDGGTASDGRPYLATEFVDGEPITAYADRRRLAVNDRLALFLDVCEAVAYAHARLVVHRDLKPSNVLVASGDAAERAEPRVKLLDFGVAKLLADDVDDDVRTQTGRRMLTPAYAAPEQLDGGPITTATDVYSLGVLLFELLTGRRPGPAGIVTRPSDAVTTAAPTGGRVPPDPAGDATGALRSTTPDRLRRRLRGDLDRIALKALRPEPEHRYRGAAELAADVRRHLDGLPVEARAPTVGYRVGRFVRRHRAGVVVVLAGLGLVVAWAATATTQARRIARERDRAEAVTDLLVGLFDGGDPDVARGDTLTALALLDSASVRLDSLAGQPDLEARLRLALARIYLQQGAFGRADTLLTPALDWQRQSGDADGLAETLYTAGEVGYWLGDFAGAEALHREGLALVERRVAAPNPELARRLDRIGILRSRQGDYPDARRFHEQALRQLRATLPPGDPRIGSMLAHLAVLDFYEGHDAESEARYREALAILEPALGRDHPEVVMTRREMAWPIGDQGRAEEAVALLEDVDRANRRLYGTGHPTVPNTLGELSRYQRAAGDLDGAEASAREGLRLIRQLYGDRHAYVANKMLDLALVLKDRGRLDEARELADEALVVYRATVGEDHPFTASGYGHVARLAALQGDRPAALRYEREAYRRLRAAYGDGHPRTDTSRARLARLEAGQ